MFGLFKKKKELLEVKAPMIGKVVDLKEVPDEVFAGKMVGDGLAIEPVEGKVVSPIDGEIVNIFPTKHAIGLKTDSGIEILIHIGLETVAMGGEGFEVHIPAGNRVKVGDTILTFDLNMIKEKAKSTISPIVITNMEVVKEIETSREQNVTTEDVIMKISKK